MEAPFRLAGGKADIIEDCACVEMVVALALMLTPATSAYGTSRLRRDVCFHGECWRFSGPISNEPLFTSKKKIGTKIARSPLIAGRITRALPTESRFGINAYRVPMVARSGDAVANVPIARGEAVVQGTLGGS